MDNEWLRANESCDIKKGMGCGNGDKYLTGLYGWRRRCLFFMLSLLLVLVVINLTLSLWMLKVMKFSWSGMGTLNIFDGGVKLTGAAIVLDKLVASKIGSRKGNAVQIESSNNISLLTKIDNGRVDSKLFLGDDRLNVMASTLKVQDSRGRLLFSVDKKEAFVGAEVLRISGDGGAVIHGSVQTLHVRPEAGQNLKLELPTRSLNIFALHGVNMESRAGDISADCLTDVKLNSKTGAVRLDAPNNYMPKVKTVMTSSESLAPTQKSSLNSYLLKSKNTYSSGKPEVFQVCVCGKGRLFLAPPEGPCVADNDVCR